MGLTGCGGEGERFPEFPGYSSGELNTSDSILFIAIGDED